MIIANVNDVSSWRLQDQESRGGPVAAHGKVCIDLEDNLVLNVPITEFPEGTGGAVFFEGMSNEEMGDSVTVSSDDTVYQITDHPFVTDEENREVFIDTPAIKLDIL